MARRRRQVASQWEFRIKISPSPDKFAKLLGETAKEFRDYKPAFVRLVPKVMAGIKRNIDSRGASLGEPWPGLKDKYYLARKARLGWSRAELFASYRLAQSFRVLGLTSRSLRVGTTVKQAKALQWGRKMTRKDPKTGSRLPGGNKPRFFIGVDDRLKQEAIDELNTHALALYSRLAQKLKAEDVR